MGKQYIFRPSSTTPQEVLDFLEEATKTTSFPKLLVSLVEKEIERQANPKPEPQTIPLPGSGTEIIQPAEGFDFSPANDSNIEQARIFEKLNEIEQKIDTVANIGLKVENKVGSVDSHLFSSMKVIDAALKEQTESIKKVQAAAPKANFSDEKSVFASMPERTIFTEMSEEVDEETIEKEQEKRC